MKSLSILLVDDDEIQRLKFRKACEKSGCPVKICEAENGIKALKKLRTTNISFDLIVSDLNMPEMDGIDLLSKLKSIEKFKSIPFVIMSTSKRREDLKKSYFNGVSGYFIKNQEYKGYSQKIISLLDYWSESELVS